MPYNNPGGIVAASVILEIIAVGCVCLRLMAVKRVGMSFSVSDYLIVSALVCATGLTVMEIYGMLFNFVHHSLFYPIMQSQLHISVRAGCRMGLCNAYLTSSNDDLLSNSP